MKKCLVLDLDNTLWGGVIGEDGMHGIRLDLNPPGNSFIAFQQAILDLYNRGIILAINSKNNYKDAIKVIREHPNMILKENHFSAMRINWQDKAKNMRELAQELNIGLDSMVFLDDDVLNRGLVQAELPEVAVPDFPQDPVEYAKFLMCLPYFEKGVLTDEDKMRGNLYVTERLRRETEKKHFSREIFLNDLKIEVYCCEDDTSCISRLSQLTERTNQFNANKIPMTEKEIMNYITDLNYGIFHARAQDRFGDYGVIAFALAKKEQQQWKIESLLMSCRALGRGIEETFLKYLYDKANNKRLIISFKKTDRNLPVEEFIKKYFDNNFVLNTKVIQPDWIKCELWKN